MTDIKKEYAERMAASREKAEKLAKELFVELKKRDIILEEMSMALIFQSAYYITSFTEAHDVHRTPQDIEDWSTGLRHVVDEILEKRYPTEWKRLAQKKVLAKEGQMDEQAIKQMASNVRRHALKEAAKAVCPYCRDGNPWGDAQCRDGAIYEHLNGEPPHHLAPCAATEIWKLIDHE